MLARFGIHICKRTSISLNVYRSSLYICVQKQWDLGYAELLNCFKVPSLGDCRNYLSLCTMYKVVHELIYIPHDGFVPTLQKQNCYFSKLLGYYSCVKLQCT